MHIDPSVVSPALIFFKSLDIDMIICVKVDPVALIPKMSLICDATMSTLTADVNPAFTGPEIKSMKKPINKSS